MFTYRVRLAPKAGSASGNLTTEVRAMSDRGQASCRGSVSHSSG